LNWDVTVERIMGRGLIGEHVGHDTVSQQLGHDLGSVAEQADRQWLFLAIGLENEMKSLFQIVGHAIEVAGLQSALDACGIDSNAKESGTVHGGSQRLSTAHAAQPGTNHQAAR